eukprot:CAMPEP_0179423042 /NCGR_PEP_ID=MMETSP0799-20121207/10780_1 /TAXON_ID=46947 /ORGANISM="Geminigera cryophila, Strain CCMP2564" /LENGTH=43 /DNA_ID= /DNA_START= /DNA_END= /DNA_ORIENTATION=
MDVDFSIAIFVDIAEEEGHLWRLDTRHPNHMDCLLKLALVDGA